MRRSGPLIPFSHDHHHGLVLCRHIREDLMRYTEPAHIIAYVREFWRTDLQRHFDEEERSVFPLLPEDEPNIRQALQEHEELRAGIATLSAGTTQDSLDILENFGKLLEAHIRFEERVLFPQIERTAL